jgi:tRNA1Val (adenine37-N6)-methyltransferase
LTELAKVNYSSAIGNNLFSKKMKTVTKRGHYPLFLPTFGVETTPDCFMSNSIFRFKQFTVSQEHCAMKVGTDGVLLGAWADADHPARLLDVGTGTGLIALMLAQRNPGAHITALEIDPAAARQAAGNVACSPWADRIEVVCDDFRCYPAAPSSFDLIVSNPPYFVDALPAPDPRRNMARHAATLSYEFLLRRSAALLSSRGRLALIIPADAETAVAAIAASQSLFPVRRLRVFTKPSKPCRRVLLSYALQPQPTDEGTLCIADADGTYSADYLALTRAFYLDK